MTVCMAAFGINDALMKVASADFSLIQAIFIRSVFTTVLLGLYAWRTSGLRISIEQKDRKLIGLRVGGEICGAFCFLTAVFNMPLANATSILQSVPLAVTLGAAIFLGEKVGWRRFGAILLGFTGVMIIIRPGSEGFNSYSFYALGAIVFIVLRDLTTRKVSGQIPSVFISFLTSLGIMVVTAGMLPFTNWTPLTFENTGILALTSLFVIIGYTLSVSSVRVGDIAFVSPFRYTILLWSIILGILFFGDIPDQWTLIGSAIVVVMGIYTFYREQKLAAR